MSITVQSNLPEIVEKLKKIPTKVAAKAVKSTFSDADRRVPTQIAKLVAQTYDIPATRVNPKTKSGSHNGSVSMGGSSLGSLSWTYTGERLTIGGDHGFKWAGGKRAIKKGTIAARILKGQSSILGHVTTPHRGPRNPDWPRSPWMRLNGKDVGLMRVGGSHVKYKGGFGDPARGPSIPQMVLSVRHEAELDQVIEETVMKRLEHNIDRYLGQL